VSSEIPDKQYFKIGEVSHITGVKAHVLRYWETEFRTIRPQKSPTNQRLYRRRDVELLLLIKKLLYKEGYTISGANKKLREMSRAGEEYMDDPLEVLQKIRGEVAELLTLVDDHEQ